MAAITRAKHTHAGTHPHARHRLGLALLCGRTPTARTAEWTAAPSDLHRDWGIGQVLLCDGCDEEIHMGCCMPPLTKVPEGDFFCTKCEEV
jgi:hypothetical protein